MLHPLLDILLPAILAVLSWAEPQPIYSEGLIVIYGNQQLVQANAHWRGYDLSSNPKDCGLSAISPVHLGQLAWVSADGGRWLGPCTVVDAVSRKDAYASIFLRHEVAEVSRSIARELGFTNGGQWGYIFFGPCPPTAHLEPELYVPRLAWDHPPYQKTPSYFPYPLQQWPIDCSRLPLPAGHLIAQ